MGLFGRSKKSDGNLGQSQRLLIIAGPACSGCALTASLLNYHPRVALSYQRFDDVSELLGSITNRPSQNAQPNWAPADIDRCESHFEEAEVIGDSSPEHEKHLAHLASQLPNARILGLNRSVYALASAYEQRKASDDYPDWAAGYQQAVQDWNRAQVSLLDISRTQPEKTLIIGIERLYSYSPIYLQNILRFLEVGAESPQIKNGYEKICKDWMRRFSQIYISDEMEKFIQQNANFEAYQLAIEFGEKNFS